MYHPDMDISRRWILAFDGSCSSCRGISEALAKACGPLIDVLPLRHPDVETLRLRALGAQPPWAATLLLVTGDEVQAWTGRRMALRLARVLGPVRASAALRSLGDLKAEVASIVSKKEQGRLSRKAFFRVAAGAAMAGGIIITGAAPASADPATLWVKLHAGRLPVDYATITQLTMDVRRAVYQTWTARQKSDAWLAHLDWFLERHPKLSSEQRALVAEFRKMAATSQTFEGTPPQSLTQLTARAQAVLGDTDSAAAFARLGPTEEQPSSPLAAGCKCSVENDWCGNGTTCNRGYDGCIWKRDGCGALWAYPCNGQCVF